jgi:hypothetical protein
MPPAGHSESGQICTSLVNRSHDAQDDAASRGRDRERSVDGGTTIERIRESGGCVNGTTAARRALVKKRIWKAAVWIGVVFGLLILLAYEEWRHHFPYGQSHCCDLQLGTALLEYASTHGGYLPAGEKTPEASLSLLYGTVLWVNGPYGANLLRGKIVPEAEVQARLDQGQHLTPETCGWHYVEGLRDDGDGQIAVCWDKVGLDHFGGLLRAGGHTVLYLRGNHGRITAAEWPNFLDEQQKLIAKSKAARRKEAPKK